MKTEFDGVAGAAAALRSGHRDMRVSRDVTQDGKTVRIEAELSGHDGWVLRVIGHQGQVSEWTDFFASSADAMTTALSAIRYEGIEDFYDDPVFQSLQEKSSH